MRGPLLAVLLAISSSAGAQAVDEGAYTAAWVAVANPEPVRRVIAEKSWASLLSFRPEQGMVPEQPLVEVGKSRPRLPAGTLLVPLRDHVGQYCRLDRPKHDYFIECVEDADRDGRYESMYLLNHGNPLLFTARRQPRHQRSIPVEPVILRALAPEALPVTDLVFHFPERSAVTAMQERYTFQLCVLRVDERNLWGDKAHGRGCLPDVVVQKAQFPVRLTVPGGRALTIAAPVDGSVEIHLDAATEDRPVRL